VSFYVSTGTFVLLHCDQKHLFLYLRASYLETGMSQYPKLIQIFLQCQGSLCSKFRRIRQRQRRLSCRNLPTGEQYIWEAFIYICCSIKLRFNNKLFLYILEFLLCEENLVVMLCFGPGVILARRPRELMTKNHHQNHMKNKLSSYK
jgi:hypothetical protein